jgi:imidazole glycerol-phosphate synthase subunit HisH
MIAIIDYGMGNLRSVQKAFERIKIDARIISDPHDLKSTDKIILPGVGHFKKGIENLANQGWIEELKNQVLVIKKPILGICLGMQLMTKFSEEANADGIGLIDATTKKFNFPNIVLKMPHMGWNEIVAVKQQNLFTIDKDCLLMYFVHSYFVQCNNPEDVLFKTNYGITFDAAFMHENIFGFQFHPEKSHKPGLNLLKNFAEC